MAGKRLGNVSAAEALASWYTIAKSSPFLCEDCGFPTDAGFKCRACYRAWSSRLWADIPAKHVEMLDLVKRFRALGPGERLQVGEAFTGRRQHALSGEAAAVLAAVRLMTDDGDPEHERQPHPFGPSIAAIVRAAATATAAETAPTKGKLSAADLERSGS
jgi:hypothetical protein